MKNIAVLMSIILMVWGFHTNSFAQKSTKSTGKLAKTCKKRCAKAKKKEVCVKKCIKNSTSKKGKSDNNGVLQTEESKKEALKWNDFTRD